MTGAQDAFCASCGTRQPLAHSCPGRSAADPLSGISPRTATILCYVPVIGWIAAIIVLASHRFRQDPAVRFHAFQGLYLFVAWLIVDWVLSPFFGMYHFLPGPHVPDLIPGLLKAAVFGSWIFMLVKVSHGEAYHLPILGELAERSVSEQR